MLVFTAASSHQPAFFKQLKGNYKQGQASSSFRVAATEGPRGGAPGRLCYPSRQGRELLLPVLQIRTLRLKEIRQQVFPEGGQWLLGDTATHLPRGLAGRGEMLQIRVFCCCESWLLPCTLLPCHWFPVSIKPTQAFPWVSSSLWSFPGDHRYQSSTPNKPDGQHTVLFHSRKHWNTRSSTFIKHRDFICKTMEAEPKPRLFFLERALLWVATVGEVEFQKTRFPKRMSPSGKWRLCLLCLRVVILGWQILPRQWRESTCSLRTVHRRLFSLNQKVLWEEAQSWWESLGVEVISLRNTRTVFPWLVKIYIYTQHTYNYVI